MIDGRRKGNSAENAICYALSKWLSGAPKSASSWDFKTVHELPFRRRTTSIVPISGFWEGGGDILHKPGVLCPFRIEVKKQQGWDLDGLLCAQQWPVWDWWEQAKGQATDKLRPLLFFSRNNKPTYVLLETGVARCLQVKPINAPVLQIERVPRSRLAPVVRAELTLCTLADLVVTERRNVLKLSRAVPVSV